jgi:cytochrome c-type biogenesis protein CcmF
MVSNYGTETDVRMSPGDVVESAGYRFQFNGVQTVPGPNYSAQRGEFIVYRGDERVTVLHPEKRSYFAASRPMTEAAIDAGFLRDIYVSLGEPVGDQGDWALRVYYKPYVRWIWLAGILMALGGILAVTDRRYRIARRSAAVPAGTGAVARG